MVINMEQFIRKYRNQKNHDLSCSETIVYAANEKFNLGLLESHFKMMAPFSGGMYEKETCGVVTGAIAVLGILFTNSNSHNSPLLQEAVIEYKTRFNTVFGSRVCETLLETQRDETLGCDDLIVQGGKLLDEVIVKYTKKYQ
jgi:C_GCAxxG_C_C family probable redox protein